MRGGALAGAVVLLTLVTGCEPTDGSVYVPGSYTVREPGVRLRTGAAACNETPVRRRAGREPGVGGQLVPDLPHQPAPRGGRLHRRRLRLAEQLRQRAFPDFRQLGQRQLADALDA